MDWSVITEVIGVGLGGGTTLYNLVTLRQLGLSAAHQQLEAMQMATLALQKDETSHWKSAYEVSQQKLAEQDAKIAAQGKCIEDHRREIELLKTLIAQQAITQGYILREVVRRPELRVDLEASWTRMEEQMSGIAAGMPVAGN